MTTAKNEGLLIGVALAAALLLASAVGSVSAWMPERGVSEDPRQPLAPAEPGGTLSGEPVTVTVESGTGGLGDTFALDVTIEDIPPATGAPTHTGLGAFDFTLSFNPAVVTVTNATLGPFLGSTGRTIWGLWNPVITAGTVQFGEATLGQTPLGADGDGVAATVTFQAVGAGQTNINFTNALVGDVLGNPFAVTSYGGAITVIPEVQFGSTTYSVGEGDGTATITVTLNAPSTQQVTVDYATSDGMAQAPGDYTAASGTLIFAPGDVSETFDVPIEDDALDEDDETVVLDLSNAVNATIGPHDPATLTIVDDDLSVFLPFVARSLGP